MDRVEERPDPSEEPEAGAEGASEALPRHGQDQPDIERPKPVEDDEVPAAEPLDVEALHAAAAQAAGLAEKLKRVEAEFLNETKRIRRQAEQDRRYAIETVVVDLLPVIDALTSARENLGGDETSQPMREGLALVEKQLQSVLERYGIAAIEAQGQPFDPARHQALMVVENTEFEPQTVCQVMRAGYELNGRVVRPAEVIVARAPAAPEPADGES